MKIKQLITNIIQRLKCFVHKSKPKATNSQDFTLDLLKIMPINSLCTIIAPDLENQTLDKARKSKIQRIEWFYLTKRTSSY